MKSGLFRKFAFFASLRNGVWGFTEVRLEFGGLAVSQIWIFCKFAKWEDAIFAGLQNGNGIDKVRRSC